MVATFFSNFMAAVTGQSSDDRSDKIEEVLRLSLGTMSRIRLISTGKWTIREWAGEELLVIPSGSPEARLFIIYPE